MPQRQRALSGFSHCEKLRDEIRQEEIGREETRKHFKGTVAGLDDSLEKGVERKRNYQPGEGAWCEGSSLHPDSAPRTP